MPVTITLVRPTFGDLDSLTAAQFNAVALSSATVPTGTDAASVCIGNDSRLSNSRACNGSVDDAVALLTALGLFGGTRSLELDIMRCKSARRVVETTYVTSGGIALAMDGKSNAFIGLTGNPTFSCAGQEAGYEMRLVLKNTTGGVLNLTWPAWTVAAGVTLPATLASGAVIVVRLYAYGTNLSDVVACLN